jgi:hypothetical protein
MSWGGGILAALVETAARPAWWVIALAGFLARGGILVILAPIVVLPSTFGLATGLSPLITQIVLAGDTGLLALLGFGGVSVAIGLVLLGGWFGAVSEVALVRDAADAMGGRAASAAVTRLESGLAIRVLAVRLLADVPLLLALIWGGVAIVIAAYAELTLPGDVGQPLADRVAARAWLPLFAVVVAWLVGDAVGAIGARRAVLRREDAGTALVRAAGELVRRPAGWIATIGLSTAVAGIVAAGCLLASNVAWIGLRGDLVTPGATPTLVLGLVLFVLTWLGALLVIGFAMAWRSASMTGESLRGLEAVAARAATPAGAPDEVTGGSSVPNGDGTFGAPGSRQSGGWSAPKRGGSL